MNCRFSSLLISSFLAAGCIQKLDDGLAAGGAAPGPAVECGGSQGYACAFPVITTTPDIATKADENGDPTETEPPTSAGACAKVIQDVTAPIDSVTHKGGILATKCAGCHQGPNAPGRPLIAILDQTKLMGASPTPRFNGAYYIVPGNPAASLIYRRAVIDRDMPKGDDTTLQPPNFLTISESSVLNQWITSCVDGAPPSGDSNTGGTSAAGGMNAGGTGAGGTGAGGAGAGGTGAGGTGAGGAGRGGTGGSAGSSSGGSAAMQMGGSGGGAAGGAGGAAAGGGAGGGGAFMPPPCAGLCRNPINFTVTPPASFSATGFGMGAACYQTTSMLNGYNCGNDGGRTFSINGTTVACGTSQAIPVPVRNGGYCFRATPAATDLGAYFTAY